MMAVLPPPSRRSLQTFTHCVWEDSGLLCTNYTAAQVNQIRTWSALTFYAIIPACILLPWCCLRVRRRCCQMRKHPSQIAPGERYADSPTVAKLVVAEQRARNLRARTAGAIAQTGWALTCIGTGAVILDSTGYSLDLFAGDITFFLVPIHLGPAILCLAIRPIDAKEIAIACRFTLGLFMSWLPWNAIAFVEKMAASGFSFGGCGFLVAVINFTVCVAVLWPAVFSFTGCRCTRSTMPPRRQLQRLWLALRLFILNDALTFAVLDKIDMAIEGDFSVIAKSRQKVGMVIFGIVGILTALALTPANRGAIHSWLGRLGKHDSKEQEAAAVAALIGGGAAGGAAAVLARAQSRFRALPVPSLTKEELMNNEGSPELSAKASAARLGDVQAFVSHSWSDDGEGKFNRLHEYAAACGGDLAAVRIWLDKACIDQNRITESLECLPVYLAGCKDLLVLAGQSYHTRLWCVMEIFVYLRMGGDRAHMVVRLLNPHAGDDEHEHDLALLASKFDAGMSQCFLDGDRQRLLAVIEASFGTFEPFNKIVRGVFHDKLVGTPAEA